MDMIIYLIKTTILIAIGVILANIILESSIKRRLHLLIKPLTRILNLPQMCVFSILTCFFSSIAGKSALAGFYREGKINDTEAMLTIIMSTFPIVLGEYLLRVQAPIALVLLGPKIGSIYVLLSLFAAFLQTFAAFIYSKKFLRPQKTQIYVNTNVVELDSNPKGAIKKSFKTLKKVIPIMIITFLVVNFLLDIGGMKYISSFFDPILRLLDLPGACATALVAQFIHFSAGYATVAMLLAQGIITSKQAIITLLIGSMIVITLIYIKHSFSMYVGLFGKFGVKITFINYLASMIAKMVTILLVVILM